MATIPDNDPIGTLIGGKYRLTRLLGEGGMGRVFAAEHTVVGRPVAVKLLHPELAERADMAERFLREARAAGSVDHPGIIDVLDADRGADGAPYMVMELLQGESLAELLARQPKVTPTQTREIARQALDALRCAHERGVIHRDLKPDNIFLADGGDGVRRVRILDFGISRIVGDDDLRLTRTGAVMGTPYYMSPEQARGEKDVDHRADIWALGVTLYQMLSGVRPYEGDSYNAVMMAIAAQPLVPLHEVAPDAPSGLVRWVERALEKDPAARYGGAAEMLQALQSLTADAATGAFDDTVDATTLPDPGLTALGEAPTLAAPQTSTDGEAPGDAAASSATASDGPQVGGFWRRGAALAVDVMIFGLLVGAPLGALFPSGGLLDVQVTGEDVPADVPAVSVSNIVITDDGVRITGDDGGHVRFDDEGLHVRGAGGEEVHVGGGRVRLKRSLVTTLKTSLWLVYCTIFLALFGATPGKMVLGLAVVQPGRAVGRLPVMTALIRSVFFFLSACAAGLGCLWSLGDPQRRTWHDRVARTEVVRTR